MDPVSLILALALKNPQVAGEAIAKYNEPGQVNSTRLQESVADFAMEVVSCYHKTARFRGVKVIGSPWRDQDKFGAEGSVVLQIDIAGVTGSGYQMVVSAMAKSGSYRAFVIAENTLIPYNKKCQLERWVSVKTG